MGGAWWQCAACLRAQEEEVGEMQLNHCNLYDVPPDVFVYERTLERLYLDANRIKDLPRPLFQCHELRILSLSDNEVSCLPPAVAALINLEILDLSKNCIKSLPDSIKECKNLHSLDLSVNPIERFPDPITHILGLQELYINDAFIEYLPANFGRLSSLRTLELRENNMMTLPKSMSRLTNLERLDIGNNDFTELPEVVGEMKNLTELWIDGNEIRKIPPNIEHLSRLNHFDCTMNAVHMLPQEVRGWRDISIMHVSCNELFQLPDSICYLETIVTLKIDDNQLNALPNEIGRMKNLEELIVNKNLLEYLPPSLGLLRKLHCLNADNNYIKSLPPEIGSCSSLSLLSLRSNNLTIIPPEIGHLSSLTVLNLVNNAIKFLPVSMLNLNNLKALWLSDNQSQPLVPLQREHNQEEDMTVLSCFMLPQKPTPHESDLKYYEVKVNDSRAIAPTLMGSGKRICFTTEMDPDIPGQLRRAPTPYPKELRNLARHARNLHQQSLLNQKTSPTISMASCLPTNALITRTSQASQVRVVSNVEEEASSPQNSTLEVVPITNVELYDESSSMMMYSSSEQQQQPERSTVVAIMEQQQPEIRQAKCIRGPVITEYLMSRSEHNASPVAFAKLDVSEAKPSPPPYHIAAAFSKKAAFFQNLENLSCPSPVSQRSIPRGENSSCQSSCEAHNDSIISRNEDDTSSQLNGGTIDETDHDRASSIISDRERNNDCSTVDRTSDESAETPLVIEEVGRVDSLLMMNNTSKSRSSISEKKLKWMFGAHKNASVMPVQVRKNPGLGFSIAGGINGTESGIIVTKVNLEGPANGILLKGDKILEVDGIDFTKSDHKQAVAVLRATGAVVSMMISRS